MKYSQQEMRGRLENVRDSYPHFVEVTLSFIENFHVEDDLMEFIDQNPDATCTDVIRERIRLVHGWPG